MMIAIAKSAFVFFAAAALLSSSCNVASQAIPAADAPTAKIDPAVLDRQWQQSGAKFDARRKQILAGVDQTIAKGPFRADWQSLQQYEIPAWYRDAKFGIFIHWGVYSVPAFGEWYARNMYKTGTPEYAHHLAVYGPPDKFGYKDFIPMFKAERFDPAAWAQLFKESGAQYVVPVAEHHDGFAMYNSELSDWTAAKMGPHRDVIADLAGAIRAEGLHFGLSSHRIEHDFFFGPGREISSDVNDPRYASLYGPAHEWMQSVSPHTMANDFTCVSSAWTEDWLARSAEIVEKYHPEIMYFDWWIGHPAARDAVTRFAAFYYNSSKAYGDHIGVIDFKDYSMEEHSAVLDLERGQLGEIRPLAWQTDTSLSNNAWGYVEHDTFKSPDFVIDQLADIVSKNGNLLLNIGPRSDGTIPDPVQATLREIGAWLKVNGEAIYGTRPWKLYGEGPTRVEAGAFHDTDTAAYTEHDFRFTTRGTTLYAIELAAPTTGKVVIQSLGKNAGTAVESVTLLGSDQKLNFQQNPAGLEIDLAQQIPGKHALAFRILIAPPRP